MLPLHIWARVKQLALLSVTRNFWSEPQLVEVAGNHGGLTRKRYLLICIFRSTKTLDNDSLTSQIHFEKDKVLIFICSTSAITYVCSFFIYMYLFPVISEQMHARVSKYISFTWHGQNSSFHTLEPTYRVRLAKNNDACGVCATCMSPKFWWFPCWNCS